MKIYTRKGDQGQTSLIGGTRVPKHHIRIEAYGTVDELNSWIGILSDMGAGERLGLLRNIQDRLFTLGSQLAADPEASRMKLPELREADVTTLEQDMDAMNETLPELTSFVLPGGHPANSHAHVARCVCRRAERLITHLAEHSSVPPLAIMYVNRLSDWLFTYARWQSHTQGSEEVRWIPAS